jgi:hypothetical protein
MRSKGKTYTAKMSFSLSEMANAKLSIGAAGVNYAMPRGDDQVRAMYQSFGWGGNSNVFIPDLNIPDDVMPKPEDFVQIPFRLLSATVVAAGTWRATDFSDEVVLKASAPKLNKKPVYLEHDTSLDNWVGIVNTPKWSSSYQSKDGDVIPAGIDGMISIDAKTNPKILRGVLAGGIFSNSVTVVFDWKPSHTFENDYQFENMVGTIAEDGNMIRRIVTKIHDYYESSLVWLGADPYAKLIDSEGELVHIDHVNAYHKSFSQEDANVRESYTHDNSFSASCGLSKALLTLTQQQIKSTFNKKLNMKPEVITALLTLLGLASVEDITDAHIKALNIEKTPDAATEAEVQANAAIATKAVSLMTAVDSSEKDFGKFIETHKFVKADTLNSLNASVEALTKDKETLTAQVEELTTQAQLGVQILTAQRAEVERLYRASALEKASDAVISLISKANFKELEALAQSYGGKALMTFGGTCGDCGSTKISFQSSKAEGTVSETDVKSSTVQDIRERYAKSSVHI